MSDFGTLFLGGLAVAALLGWAWERQRHIERDRTDAATRATVKAAIDGLRAELKAAAEYEAVVRALGMMKDVAATRAAEPDVLHPIVETKLAEARLFDLAEQRKLQGRVSDVLNGKEDA